MPARHAQAETRGRSPCGGYVGTASMVRQDSNGSGSSARRLQPADDVDHRLRLVDYCVVRRLDLNVVPVLPCLGVSRTATRPLGRREI